MEHLGWKSSSLCGWRLENEQWHKSEAEYQLAAPLIAFFVLRCWLSYHVLCPLCHSDTLISVPTDMLIFIMQANLLRHVHSLSRSKLSF